MFKKLTMFKVINISQYLNTFHNFSSCFFVDIQDVKSIYIKGPRAKTFLIVYSGDGWVEREQRENKKQ